MSENRPIDDLFAFSRPPYLVLLESGVPDFPERGRRFELEGKNEWVIGSDIKDDIELTPEVAEKNHARLQYKNGTWFFLSEKRIYSNQLLVHNHRIKDGDLLTIGGALFKFFSGIGPNAVYDQESYEKGTLDALTLIFNKGFFTQSLTREYKRCKRLKQPLSLVMFDIDHFKSFNTNYGHRGGDTALRQLTQRISKVRVREDEIFARWGGEEFALILPNANHEQALKIGEHLCQLTRSTPIFYKEQELPISISIGVATLEQKDMEELLKDEKDLEEAANVFMHQAKKNGRDQVVG